MFGTTKNHRSIWPSTGGLLSIGLIAALTGACGDDGGGGMIDEGRPELGFATPTVTTTAFREVGGVWQEQGPANWSCLNTASTDMPTSVDVTLTGPLIDFQSDEPLPMAELTLYGDEGIDSTPVTTTTADVNGDYELLLPKGGTHWAFKIKADDALDTYTLNQYFDPDTAAQEKLLESISVLTAQALPAFINVTRTPGLGIVAGAIRDCDNNEVSGAIAAVSSSDTTVAHIDGGVSYYFSALMTSLPVRHSQQNMTNKDGRFVTIELPPGGTGSVQIYGFIDDDDLADGVPTLLSTISSPVLADTVVRLTMNPTRE
jgi:hypothetical protein